MWIKREEWKHSNEMRVKSVWVQFLPPFIFCVGLGMMGYLAQPPCDDIYRSVFTPLDRVEVSLCVLFSRVSSVLMLQADLMKAFVVFSLLNCQGFLDMEKRVCGYFVCVVRCVCVCVCVCVQFSKKLQLPFVVPQWSAVRWKGNRNTV